MRREPQALATDSDTEVITLEQVFERFSSWLCLKNFIAWILRYRENLCDAVNRRKVGKEPRMKKIINPISVEEIKRAEREIVICVQGSSFREEVSGLMKSERNNETRKTKSSSIQNLDPRLQDGILRVGGRLKNPPIKWESKHPMILPKNHHVSKLIVQYYHRISAHAGREHVLSLLRERFWIVGARIMVKRLLNICIDCRKRHGPSGEQKMADLPEDRVIPNKPPFTFVGVDCFGPFTVKKGRSTVKRYSVLFTCLTVRAIHIEIAHSLDTDSFLQAMQRFVSRRGFPEVMR